MPKVQGKPCPNCSLVKHFTITDDEFLKLRAGEFIQDVFPDMEPQDREAFVSGYCPPCWDALFCFDEEGD